MNQLSKTGQITTSSGIYSSSEIFVRLNCMHKIVTTNDLQKLTLISSLTLNFSPLKSTLAVFMMLLLESFFTVKTLLLALRRSVATTAFMVQTTSKNGDRSLLPVEDAGTTCCDFLSDDGCWDYRSGVSKHCFPDAFSIN